MINVIAAESVRPGMYLKLWFGTHRVVEVEPYIGTLAPIMVGIARFPGGLGISLERGLTYEVE